MKHDFPTRAGIGFTVVLAGLTFAVAVLSGIFLIRESDTGPQPVASLEWPGLPPVAQGRAIPATDHLHAKPQRIARIPHSRRGKHA